MYEKKVSEKNVFKRVYLHVSIKIICIKINIIIIINEKNYFNYLKSLVN